MKSNFLSFLKGSVRYNFVGFTSVLSVFYDFIDFLLNLFFGYRFHELQDRITPVAYVMYSDTDTCPENCQYSNKQTHYHCIWVMHSISFKCIYNF